MPTQLSSNQISRVIIFVALLLFGCATAGNWDRAIFFLPTGIFLTFVASRIDTSMFSALDMGIFCYFMYFVVSPMQRVDELGLTGNTLGGMPISTSSIIQAAILPLAIFILVWFAYKTTTSLSLPQLSLPRFNLSEPTSKNIPLFLFSVAIVSLVIYIVVKGGLQELLRARNMKTGDSGVSIFPALALSFFFIPTLFLVAWRTLLHKRNRYEIWRYNIFLAILLPLLLLAVNPFNSPRFINISVWLPILLVAFSKFLRFRIVYTMVLFGIIVLMPLMSFTSRFGLEGTAMIDKENYIADAFKIQDVDVFDTLSYAIDFPKANGYGHGKNIMTNLFFFVPRTIWPSKGIGGGLEVGEELKTFQKGGTANLSFFPGGELYLDFGWAGIIVGSLAIGFFVAFLRLPPGRKSRINLLDVIFVGFIPILLRGPFNAVSGYFFAYLIALTLISYFLKQKTKNSPKRVKHAMA